MHLVDTYGLQCGSKIEKPFILESYFPLPIENFITFQAQSKYEAKDYDYWQAVINILAPMLESKGIKIVQVGGLNEMPYQRVIDLRGQTNFHQLAYVIKRAKLHLGPDSLPVHLASYYDTPIVALYSVSSVEASGPRFGTPAKQVLFKGYERVGNGKPSYAAQENPKSINSIKPEEISNAVFKLLEIEFEVPFETVHIGAKYNSKLLRELVPDTHITISNPEAPIEIRADIHFDERIVARQLSYLQKSVIITDKAINVNLLKQFKQHIGLVVYRITENDDPSFVKQVIAAGLPVMLLSKLAPEVLEKKKIQYYEFGKIHVLPTPSQETIAKFLPDIDKLYYHSNKLIASKGKLFASHAARELEHSLQNDHEYTRVIDSPSFWDDLDFYTIVRKTK